MIEKMPDERKPLTIDDEEYGTNLPLNEFLDSDLFGPCRVVSISENPDPFHKGQDYKKTPVRQIKCYKCNGTNFHVAMGSYHTAIRCVTCRWEACAHSG